MDRIKNKRQEYNRRWAEKNKERKRYLSFRATAKTFIRHYAEPEDLRDLKELIKEKERGVDAND